MFSLVALWSDGYETSYSIELISAATRGKLGQEQTSCLGLWYSNQRDRRLSFWNRRFHSLVHSLAGGIAGKQHFSEVSFPGVVILFCLEDFSRYMGEVNWPEIWDSNLGHPSF